MRTTKFFGLAVAAVLSMGASSAMAAACSTYLNGATSALLNTTNVSINAVDATDCYGHVLNTAIGSGNNLSNVVNFANSTPVSGGSWNGILRADTSSASGSYAGLSFAVSGLQFNTNDTLFTLTITDLDPMTAPSLPVKMDLLMTLKSSTETDFYFFDDINLSASNNGTYTMAITNNNGGLQALSDISLMGRNVTSACVPGTPGCDPNQVPEPGSALLAGLALAATGLAMRRRRQA